MCVGGGGGGGGTETKTASQIVSNEEMRKYKEKKYLHYVEQVVQCTFQKYVNNFISTNPTTLILSSLVSEF